MITTKNTMNRVPDTTSRIWLFASRAEGTRQSGDINLLIETEAALQR